MLLNQTIIDEMNLLGKTRVPFLFIIDFEGLSPCVIRLSQIPESIRFSLPGMEHTRRKAGVHAPSSLVKRPVPYAVYLSAFEKVMHHLRQGNSYLVNLTFSTPIETNLSLEEIYEISEAPYKLFFRDRFVVFSPESFVRINGRMISSYPMKGTIDASIPNAAAILLEDAKESAEHTTIVDLIRNDLSQVADQVEVAKFRYVDRIQTNEKDILQVSSEIKGRLPMDFHEQIGSIIDSLLPAGSISGAPKKSTLTIIGEAEPEQRGYYTGVFGIFDGRNLDSAVMIRFIEQTTDGLRYRSGGGITHLSKPEAEYQEMLDKVYLQVTSDKDRRSRQ